MLKSASTWLILLGAHAIIAGILALASPVATILALAVLFAVYAFIAAGLQAARAFTSATAGPVFGHLLGALIDLAAGVVALLWPAPTALGKFSRAEGITIKLVIRGTFTRCADAW